MNLNEFIEKHNVAINEDKVKSFEVTAKQDGKRVMENIYNALQKFNASAELIKKILQNTYTWYELVDDCESQISDFVKQDSKLDESGLYYWLISD